LPGAVGSHIQCVTTTVTEAHAFLDAHVGKAPESGPHFASVNVPAGGLTVNPSTIVGCGSSLCTTADNLVYLGRDTQDIHFAGNEWDWVAASDCSAGVHYAVSDLTIYSGANDVFSSAY